MSDDRSDDQRYDTRGPGKVHPMLPRQTPAPADSTPFTLPPLPPGHVYCWVLDTDAMFRDLQAGELNPAQREEMVSRALSSLKKLVNGMRPGEHYVHTTAVRFEGTMDPTKAEFREAPAKSKLVLTDGD
jgi:hypothetical protein